MAKQRPMGLLLNGSLKQSGVTFYLKNGQMIARSAHSMGRRSNTRAQFERRQRMRHAVALWNELKWTRPMFSGGRSAYTRFLTLAAPLPAVYVPCRGDLRGATLLLPGMPLSEGTLPHIGQWLGSVDGTAALQTDLRVGDLRRDEVLRLYTLRQVIERGCPQVRVEASEVDRGEIRTVDGCVALVDEAFGDEMVGWALVRIEGGRCSTQSVVTRCTVYEQYTTEASLLSAAESYGGLTD